MKIKILLIVHQVATESRHAAVSCCLWLNQFLSLAPVATRIQSAPASYSVTERTDIYVSYKSVCLYKCHLENRMSCTLCLALGNWVTACFCFLSCRTNCQDVNSASGNGFGLTWTYVRVMWKKNGLMGNKQCLSLISGYFFTRSIESTRCIQHLSVYLSEYSVHCLDSPWQTQKLYLVISSGYYPRLLAC